MKYRNYRKLRLISALIAIAIFAASAAAQTTAFNYQGKLNDAGVPASGSYQLQFKLFDAAVGGGQIGATVADVPVTATNGVFSVKLDFGAAVFTGANRFLEISVRHNSSESYVTLSPREQIASTPYSIRTLSAAQADLSLDSNKLGGVAASQYVTTSTVGNSFIKNDTVPQTGNFNITGNGIVGGSIGIATTPQAGFKLDVNGNSLFRTPGTGGNIQLGTPGGETGITIGGTNRADIRFDGTSLKLFAGTGAGIPGNGLAVTTSGTVGTSGNLGVGTFNPDTRLTLNGGPVWTSGGWTASMNLRNGAAIGWDANSSGRRWGILGSNAGLVFLSSFSSFGTTTSPAEVAMNIDDKGVMQPRQNGGLAKAMVTVNPNGTIARCFNGLSILAPATCDITVTRTADGRYTVNFHFQVDDRFVVGNAVDNPATGCLGSLLFINTISGTNVNLATTCGGPYEDAPFTLVVY